MATIRSQLHACCACCF